jgi:hypothetical protein
VIVKVRESLAVSEKQHRIWMWKNLISGIQVSRGLGNIVRFRSQIFLQLWRT